MNHHPILSRRAVLGGASLAGLAAAAAGSSRVFAAPRPAAPLALDALRDGAICRTAASAVSGPVARPGTKLRLTWNANAVCTVGVPVAQARGHFAARNLDVEFVNFGGSTDQLLEAIATGKADAGVGMALRWLKPLEQGFDVKIVSAIHGGCMRLFTAADTNVRGIADLRGKTVGVSDMAAPDKNFFTIVAAKAGIDPNDDIQWRQYPADLLSVALKRGEIQAFALGDPLGWVVRDREGLIEIANNLQGEYGTRTCCILGVRGSLIRDDRETAAALSQALLDAQHDVVADPDYAAQVFSQYSPTPVAQLAAMLRAHTHGDHPQGAELRRQLAAYVNELKLVRVIKPGTDADRFATKITADVSAA